MYQHVLKQHVGRLKVTITRKHIYVSQCPALLPLCCSKAGYLGIIIG